MAEFPLGPGNPPFRGQRAKTFNEVTSQHDVPEFVLCPFPLPYHDGVAPLITLTLFVFATARSSELVIGDAIMGGFRAWWDAHTPEGSLRRKLITCYWCVSIWAAVLVWAPLYAVFFPPAPGPWWAWWAVATMAFSYLSVLLADAQKLLNHKQKAMALLTADPDQPDTEG